MGVLGSFKWPLGVAVCLYAVSSAAQGSQSDKVAADALFDAARELMELGKYDEACPKLADSQRLDPGIGTLLNLGRCYSANGQTASAWATYREAAAAARAEGQAEREALARDEASKLEPRLTRVIIRVFDGGAAAGVTVKRDGEELPQSLWGVPMPVDPGQHTMEASAPGKTPRNATFEAKGEGAVIEVKVPPLSDAPGVTAPPPAAVEPPAPAQQPAATANPVTITDQPAASPSGADQTQRIVGYVAAGLGVAAGATGVAFGLKGNDQNSQAKELCKDAPDACPQPDYDRIMSLRDAAEKNYRNSYIFYGVGAALLGTGVVLLLTADSAPAGVAWSIEGGVGPNGAVARLGGVF